MHLITCPFCGPRNEDEFCYGGEAHVAYPQDPEKVSDQVWSDYLFNKKNTRGIHLERWRHTFGCRQWFNMARHTVSHEVLMIYKIGDPAPMFAADGSLVLDADAIAVGS